MTALRRLAPALLLLAVLAAAWAAGLPRLLSWAALAEHEAALRGLVGRAPLLAAAAYVAAYALAVACSIPLGGVFTVTGGLLFGTLAGGALAVAGASGGAVLLFLAARTALGPVLAARAGPWLARLRPGLQRDAFSYLLAMRLIPAVPFWLTNIAPAVLGVRLPVFALATVIGIVPATFVFASIGAGLGGVLSEGGTPDLSLLWSAPVLGPLLGLAALALLPVGWRHWQARRG